MLPVVDDRWFIRQVGKRMLWVPADGEKVRSPRGFEGYEFFSHRPYENGVFLKSGWVITEARTGAVCVEPSPTQEVARRRLAAKFRQFTAAAIADITEQRCQKYGLSPRYQHPAAEQDTRPRKKAVKA